VLRKLRKLPWAANEAYLVRAMLGAMRNRAGAAPLLASLAAGLSRYHPSLGVRLVDTLLEDTRAGLESPQLGEATNLVCTDYLFGQGFQVGRLDTVLERGTATH